MFTEQQPDWNWDNPEVREDFLKTLRFWCDHGTDGFRVDVAHALVKDLNRDDLDEWSIDACHFLPSDGSHPVYDRNGVHDIYRSWRRVFNEYDPPRFAVAEAWVNPDRQYLYSSPDELGQTFNFEFAKQIWARNDMHAAIENGLKQAERAGSTSTWVLNNHDLIRSATRFALPQVPADNGLYHAFPRDWVLRGGATYREDRAKGTQRSKAALMLEMGLPGSAYIYQGEELGLFEVADIPWNRLEDPWALHTSGANINKGRDGCRVPLPWVATDTPNSTMKAMNSAMSADTATARSASHEPRTQRISGNRICPNLTGLRIMRLTHSRLTPIPCSTSTDGWWPSDMNCLLPTPLLPGRRDSTAQPDGRTARMAAKAE